MKSTKKIKITILMVLLLLPRLATAHGEEVLITLAIYPLSVIIFSVSLVFIPLTGLNKGILTVSYLTAFIANMFFTNSLPYRGNSLMINLSTIFFPGCVAITVYSLLKSKEQKNII